MKKEIVHLIHQKSNISYRYYHLFADTLVESPLVDDSHASHYIVYILESDIDPFIDFYCEVHNYSISDVFFERLSLNQAQKKQLFSFIFRDLFWFRCNRFLLLLEDYRDFISFLKINSSTINRIYLEDMQLDNSFLSLLSQETGFSKLEYLSFDNNPISDIGWTFLVEFFKINHIHLQYLSLSGCQISQFQDVCEYVLLTGIRILDISSNNIQMRSDLLQKILHIPRLEELYISDLSLDVESIDALISILEWGQKSLRILRMTFSTEQYDQYYQRFMEIQQKQGIYIDIGIDQRKIIKSYPTIYIKGVSDNEAWLSHLQNEYFYLYSEKNSILDISSPLQSYYFRKGIHLFLFDIRNFDFIDDIISSYHFSYIYLENYTISDAELRHFIQIIQKNRHKYFKINMVSIELTADQMEYMIHTLPENILFIEVNLRKIQKNREVFIFQMLQKKVFVFENYELYKKLFLIPVNES